MAICSRILSVLVIHSYLCPGPSPFNFFNILKGLACFKYLEVFFRKQERYLRFYELSKPLILTKPCLATILNTWLRSNLNLPTLLNIFLPLPRMEMTYSFFPIFNFQSQPKQSIQKNIKMNETIEKLLSSILNLENVV